MVQKYTCKTHVDTSLKKSYMVTFTCAFYLIPCLVLAAVYGLIANHITKESLPVDSNTGGDAITNSRKNSLSKRKQAIYMLKIITFVFFICLLPMHVVRNFIILADNSQIAKLGLEGYLSLLYFARVMLYLNSCINPIVYNLYRKNSNEFPTGCSSSTRHTSTSDRRGHTNHVHIGDNKRHQLKRKSFKDASIKSSLYG